MKYPQNEEQSMQAIKEYEEFIAANGKYDVRINLDDERDSELIVSQVDACFYRGKILGDKVMFTEMQFTEGEEYEDAELHINKVEIPFALLEKVMNVINTYRQ